MNIILIVFLAALLFIFLCLVLYLIFSSPEAQVREFTTVNCPDFWKNTSNLNATSLQGCSIPSSSHASYNNIGECKPYVDSNGNTYLDHCSANTTAHNDPSSYTPTFANDDYVGLTIKEIKSARNCEKYNWTKLNNIKWNGISNNYNLQNSCLSK